jgi:hypothetical protein
MRRDHRIVAAATALQTAAGQRLQWPPRSHTPPPRDLAALPAACAVLAVALAACGARSELIAPPIDAAASCAPGIVAQGTGYRGPRELGSNATHFVWFAGAFPSTSTSPGLQRCARRGCVQTVPETLASGLPGAYALALDDAEVFWNDASGGVFRCNLQGCSPTAFVRTRSRVESLALDATMLFMGTADALSACPRTSCSAPSILANARPGAGITRVVLDDTDVYFIDDTLASPVLACAKTGCGGAPRTVAADAGAMDLALDDTNVYFIVNAGLSSSAAAGAILSCPKSGCVGPPAVVARGLNHPSALVVDAERVYWIDNGSGMGMQDGDVMSCPKSGCTSSPTVYATNLWTGGIAVDDRCVYWVSSNYDFHDSFAVYRAPR